MKRLLLLLPGSLSILFLVSCGTTTSISNVGRNALYRGELAETDVLGLPMRGQISEADIRAALAGASSGRVGLRSGESILLIQSGALKPDPEMQSAFDSRYRVVTCSGLPDGGGDKSTPPDPKRIRLAAARAGATKIVCVWGLVETADASSGLDIATWVPVVGDFIPGKRSVSRLTLRGLVMDTASGRWSSTTTEPVTSDWLTARVSEDLQTTRRILAMKKSAYEQLAARL